MNDQTRSRWSAILLVYGLSVASAMVVSEGAPALGGIAAEFQPQSPSMVGLVMSIPALVVVVCGLFAGWLVDSAGDRRLLLIGGAIMVAGDFGVINAPAMPHLLLFRAIAGIGYLCTTVAAVTMVMRLSHGRARVAALALWSTVIPVSFIVSFIAGALLLEHGWRAIFLSHALVSAALLATAFFALPARREGDAEISRTAGMASVLRSPWPYALGLSFAAAAFLQTGMIAVLVKLLAMRFGALEAEVHAFGSIAMLFNLGGALAVGTLLNRGVPAWLIGASGAFVAALTTAALHFWVADLPSAIALDCTLMLSLGLLTGMWALLPTVAPSPQTFGATSGLITQITLVGVLFGPPAAFAALSFGPAGSIALIAIMLIGTAAAIPVWLRQSPTEVSPGAATAH